MDILAEPETGADLELVIDKRKGDEILEGRLVSSQTGTMFPIVRGIPRFVPEDNYAKSFGFQWNKFREVQLDSMNGATYSRDRYEAEAGWHEDELEGEWLLDAGCGAGRFAEVSATYGPKLVAMDFSAAVDAAAETLADFPNAHVVQGNLLCPPFKPQSFAYAYCIGVVQHTPDPVRVIKNILQCVRPGGEFALTIYGRRIYSKLSGKYLIRPITKRVPQKLLLSAIEKSMPVVFPVTDKLFNLPVVGRGFRFAIPVANWPDDKGFTHEQRVMETIQDTFDALSPTYDNPMSPREVEAVLKEVGVSDYFFRTKIPVNVVGSL